MAPGNRGPYNLPSGERDIDDLTYNPQADTRPDNAAFDPNADNESLHPVGARGAGNQPTRRDWQKEDRETARSDETGQIPRGEVDDLLNSASREERSAQGRTRGAKVDAWRQEKEVDQFLDETGITNADQDVEISRATG